MHGAQTIVIANIGALSSLLFYMFYFYDNGEQFYKQSTI
jgi:hypothetical protein